MSNESSIGDSVGRRPDRGRTTVNILAAELPTAQSSERDAMGAAMNGLAIGLPAQWAPTPGSSGLRAATVLIADPARSTRHRLSAGLLERGIGRVLEADSTASVDDLINRGISGHLALISLAFGQPADRLIESLLLARWQRVIALAPNADAESVLDALRAGVSGVLRGLPGGFEPGEVPRTVTELTPREIEVLEYVADGRTNKWIGESLSLSSLTVKSHLARIGRKLGTGDRAQMVAVAMRAGALH
jgi:DNA-binding NarL/FixJ family response regulator